MPKLLVIDGNSLLFRAFYATSYPGSPIMRTKEGVPTNAIFAFGNMIHRILSSFKSDEHIIVAFDTGKKTFRHSELDTYKANRKPVPEELISQMPLARELLHALGIYTSEIEGYEGDDIAGTIAKIASKEGYEVEIYTSDKDFLQLIDENIEIHILRKGLSEVEIVDSNNMIEKFGFTPIQILDFKGLRGDSSDNLPGIPGVGDKTAVKLIQEYGNLEAIIEAAPNMKSKLGEKIVQNADLGRMCKHLAQIITDVPLNFGLKETEYLGFDFSEISSFCTRYELKQLLTKITSTGKQKINNEVKKEIEVIEISSFKDINKPGSIGIALDKEDASYHKADLFGLAISIDETVYYIDASNINKDSTLKEWLKDESIKKYCYDYKAIKVLLNRFGIEVNGLEFDILLASYLLDSSLRNDEDVVFSYFNVAISQNEEISLLSTTNQKRTGEIAYYSLNIASKVKEELIKNNAYKLFVEIECPLAEVLSKMEIEGFPLNSSTLDKIGEQFRINLQDITKKIYLEAGEEFNISSPKQVAYILYEKLGLPGNKKGSTSVDVLKSLIQYHPIVSLILEHRKYAKLVSTYIDGLESYLFEDGKLHAIFNQALTTTGRLSSSEPNLQNISVRDEEGKSIRKAFYYDDDEYYILSLDYAQIELRILASLSKCQKLIDAFKNDEDIHSVTARHIFHINGEVPSSLRRKAKAVNFGIVYGISDWGLSEQINVSPKEAKEIINSFYSAYPEIASYLHEIVQGAELNGYVTTSLGRRRYLREIHDSSYQVREFAKRAAMNAPIQGTAADLIKIAMIKIDKELSSSSLRAKMVLQIHDELIFKVHKDDLDEVYNLVKEVMESAMTFDTPLKVDGSYAKTWYDAK